MKHTVHLFVGTTLERVSKDLKKYIALYGENDTRQYCHVIGWAYTNEKWHATLFKDEAGCLSDNFGAGMEEYHGIMASMPEQVHSDEEVKYFFTGLYNKTVTIQKSGDSPTLQLCIYFPLYCKSDWEETQRIITLVEKISKPYNINILGFSDELVPVFCMREEYEKLKTSYSANKECVEQTIRGIISFKNGRNVNFIVLQNCNSQGISLNLDYESFIRIIGEFAIMYTENHADVFSTNMDNTQSDLTALGLSALFFDKFHFIRYLLRRSFLYIMERENVPQSEVDINKISQIAQQILRDKTSLFSDFYEEVIKPLLKNDKSQEEIIADIDAKLWKKIDEVKGAFWAVIYDGNLSLPEKQAVMAQALGLDDSLLTGGQFDKNQLIVDDCLGNAIDIYIQEYNKQKNVDGLKSPITFSLLSDGTQEAFLPLEQMKELRFQIRGSTSYIRSKSKELENVKAQQGNIEAGQGRLTNLGFIYGGTTFKLLGYVEEKPLAEVYEPQGASQSSVDLRRGFTRVKSQGKLGTCAVFSVTSVVEYILRSAGQDDCSLSERFVYYNVKKNHGEIDGGCSLDDVLESIKEEGICKGDLCPYSMQNYKEKPSEDAYEDGGKHKISIARRVKPTHRHLTSALSEGYPIIISLKIYCSFDNNNKGFVFLPDEEETKNKDYGRHAMVICGYSEEHKVYIVRNSWGEDFGDGGYCYIPFSYIENTDLLNSACIITLINQNEKAESTDSHTVAPFDMTDAHVKYSIIRILLDEEKQLIAELNKKYEALSLYYENIIQILCVTGKRDTLKENARGRLAKEISDLEIEYDVSLNKTIANQNILRRLLWFIIGIFNPSYKHGKTEQRKRQEEELKRLSETIAIRKEELSTIRLRLHFAGMVIDGLKAMKDSLSQTYVDIKFLVKNLATWYREEAKKEPQKSSSGTSPFITLITDDALDAYFKTNKGEITGDIHLYEYLDMDKNKFEHTAIREYKIKIKETLIEKLSNALRGFNVYRHISGNENYPYLDRDFVSNTGLLPLLDNNSDIFVQTRQIPSTTKYVFIRLETQKEKNDWDNYFPKYFQSKPLLGDTESVFKIVEVQKIDLQYEEINN